MGGATDATEFSSVELLSETVRGCSLRAMSNRIYSAALLAAMCTLSLSANAQNAGYLLPSFDEPSAEAGGSTSNLLSVLGGTSTERGTTTLSVQLGYPELRVAWHGGITDSFEIAPRFNFFYAGFGNRLGGSIDPPQVGVALGADFKWTFYSGNKFHAAAIWRVGFNMEFLNGFNGALQIGLPGAVAMSYELNEKIELLFGLDINMGVGVTGGAPLFVPVVANVGMAYKISENMTFTGSFEAGPSIMTVSRGSISFTQVTGWTAFFAGLEFYL